MAEQFRGVYGIPVTPFTEDGSAVDFAALEAVIDYTIEAGAHGLVNPVNVSEFFTLTDQERKDVTEATVKVCAGRVPVIAGVPGASKAQAVEFARHAARVGVDSVMAVPPYVKAAGREEIIDYFQAIGMAAELPVWIQNCTGAVGTQMPPALLADIIRSCEHVEWLKEETDNSSHNMTQAMELSGDALKGVMGGKGGRFLLDEFRRGACGTMPGSELTEIHVALWEALEAGDQERIREAYNVMLPLINVENQYGGAVFCKEVFRRRGLIPTAIARQPGVQVLDEFDHLRLDEMLADADAYFTNHKPAQERPAGV